MRLPDFLVIGSQKCGTSTLSSDLSRHPSIYIPDSKEVSALKDDKVLSERGRLSYGDYYRHAYPEQFCGDVSTAYSKLPKIKGVPERARRLLGGDVKILYVVRNPINRLISHHKHIYPSGKVPQDINLAVQQYCYFKHYSCYALQLRAWLRQFSSHNIRVVHFESYAADRQDTLDRIAEFLGLEKAGEWDISSIQNRAEDRRDVSPITRKLLRSKVYKAYIKPNTPDFIGSRLRRVASHPAELTWSGLSNSTCAWLIRELKEDEDKFARMLGQHHMDWRAYSWTGGAVLRPFAN